MSTFKLLYHTPLCDKNETIDYKNIIDRDNNYQRFIHNKMNNNNPYLDYTSMLFINMKNYGKFEILKMFMFNPFIDPNNKKSLIEYFCKVQTHYHALSYFAFQYKYKRAKIVNDKDLFFNKIIETQPRILSLYVKNTKYLFSISDLKNIINTSLYNTDLMFSMPLSIKNPYDNTPFSKANLYNIYLFFKHNDIMMPTIFHLYFISNFNIKKFQNDHEVIIRNYLINNYLRINTKTCIVKHIKKMLTEFNNKHRKHKINIDSEIPNDLLFNTFKYHNQIYYKYRHTLDLSIKQNYKYKWIDSLMIFKKNNPIFGRKMYGINKNNKKYIYFKDPINNVVKDGWFKNDTNSHLDHTNTESDEEIEEEETDIEEETREEETEEIIEAVATLVVNTDDDNDSDSDSDSDDNSLDRIFNNNTTIIDLTLRRISFTDSDSENNSLHLDNDIIECLSDDSISSMETSDVE